jgi:hypothetical protein
MQTLDYQARSFITLVIFLFTLSPAFAQNVITTFAGADSLFSAIAGPP